MLSALVFTLSWWLGMYLLARDPRKPVLALAAVGLCGFAAVVAADAVRAVWHPVLLGRVEIYLAVLPGVAWFAVLLELSRPCDRWTGRARDVAFIGGGGGGGRGPAASKARRGPDTGCCSRWSRCPRWQRWSRR